MPKFSQIDEVPCQVEVRILQKITLKSVYSQRHKGSLQQFQQRCNGDGSISEPLHVTIGVLQGDVLAPFLFTIFVDYLLGKASGTDSGVVTGPRSRRYPAKMLNDWDFADDIALPESSMPQAQSQLTRTADAAAELGLVISAPKTEFMTIHCNPQPPL